MYIRNNHCLEGQKKATSEEWEVIEKKSNDSIGELKKDVKELTARLVNYISVSEGKYSGEVCEATRTVHYPTGADTAQKALEIYDINVINLTKKFDLLESEYSKRVAHQNSLLRLKAELSIAVPNEHSTAGENASSKAPNSNKTSTQQMPPLTVEEDESRKLICHLENEIIRINVQWSQGEHIRKKYKSIKASLMSDAEKFEKNLLEIENALRQQNLDIDKIKVGVLSSRS